jgi:cytochrome c-type protein NapC
VIGAVNWLSAISWIVLLADAILIAILLTQWRSYTRRGRLALLMPAMFVVPAALVVPATQADLEHMRSRDFCVTCHEMKPYSDSLLSDNEESVPALHYQNNRVPQRTACYSCHTDYTLFGGTRAKLTGLRHMYVHYFKGAPAAGQIKLYGKFNTQNCLYCHGPAKNFLESKTHTRKTSIEDMRSGKKSCLDCHDVTHVIPGKAAHAGE